MEKQAPNVRERKLKESASVCAPLLVHKLTPNLKVYFFANVQGDVIFY